VKAVDPGYKADSLVLLEVSRDDAAIKLGSRRRREIAIRMAVGATSGRVRRLVMRKGMAQAAAGTPLGLLLVAAMGRTVASLLYGVKPIDPLSLTLAAALLLTVAAIACWSPARRASRTNPILLIKE